MNKLLQLLLISALYSLVLILIARRSPTKHYKGWFGLTIISVGFYYLAEFILNSQQ
jgi:uncharacterized membrane protein YfcA